MSPKTKQKTLVKYGYDPEQLGPRSSDLLVAEYNDFLIASSSNGDRIAVDGKRGKVVA